jgi:hypothetical protein
VKLDFSHQGKRIYVRVYEKRVKNKKVKGKAILVTGREGP